MFLGWCLPSAAAAVSMGPPELQARKGVPGATPQPLTWRLFQPRARRSSRRMGSCICLFPTPPSPSQPRHTLPRPHAQTSARLLLGCGRGDANGDQLQREHSFGRESAPPTACKRGQLEEPELGTGDEGVRGGWPKQRGQGQDVAKSRVVLGLPGVAERGGK